MPEQCVCGESFAFPVILWFYNSKSGSPEVFFLYFILRKVFDFKYSITAAKSIKYTQVISTGRRMLIGYLNDCCSLLKPWSCSNLSGKWRKENSFSTSEVKSWLHPQRHRRAEHEGVLVLCTRHGDNIGKKLSGKCENFPEFLQQRRDDHQGLSQKESHSQTMTTAELPGSLATFVRQGSWALNVKNPWHWTGLSWQRLDV